MKIHTTCEDSAIPILAASLSAGTIDRDRSVLAYSWNELTRITSCSIHIGAEIEFYLDKAFSKGHIELLDKFEQTMDHDGIQISPVKSEIGNSQYEVALFPSSNPIFFANEIEHLKTTVTSLAERHGCSVSFAARPDFENPPSSLQICVSLIDERGRNCFAKRRGDIPETDILQHSIAGLSELMNASMVFFAPRKDSYRRFQNRFDSGQYKCTNAPTTVSWGGNNRTVAIRIPTSSEDPESRHLEHRVPCSDANPALTIASILAGISYGIERRLSLILPKTWDCCSDAAGFPPLVRSIEEAVTKYKECGELHSRMNLFS